MGSLSMARCHSMPRSSARVHLLLLTGLAVANGCKTDYDEAGFRKAIERAYGEAHPGWTIFRKKGDLTWFHRGDQVDELDVGALFAEYRSSGLSGTDFVTEWREAAVERDKARRRTLEEAEEDVIPILKSAKWVEYQDLGAIGPRRRLPEIRPWRQELTPGVYVVLGVPEEKLGFRFVSIAEVERTGRDGSAWLEQATSNLVRRVHAEALRPAGEEGSDAAGAPSRAYEGVGVEVKGRLKAFDLVNVDGISGMILDRGFRKAMLDKFGLDELGAAVPIRNVLIVFDPNDFVAVKPARNRAHQLYDTQNHPGFRGLLRFDEDGIGVLEPGDPPKR